MLRFLASLCAVCVLCGESVRRGPHLLAGRAAHPAQALHRLPQRAASSPTLDVSAGLALDKPENIRKGGKDGKVPVLVAGQAGRVADRDAAHVEGQETGDAARRRPAPGRRDRHRFASGSRPAAPEGTKPKEDDTRRWSSPAPPKVRKLDVTFATKAALPKTRTSPARSTLTLPVGPLPPVAAVAFSPDGKLLASGIYGRVTVWDLAPAKPVKFLTNVLGAVNDLKFSPDGKLLAVAGGQPSARGDLRLFDTTDWKLLALARRAPRHRFVRLVQRRTARSSPQRQLRQDGAALGREDGEARCTRSPGTRTSCTRSRSGRTATWYVDREQGPHRAASSTPRPARACSRSAA